MSDTLNSLKALASSQQKFCNPFEDSITNKPTYIPKSNGDTTKFSNKEIKKLNRKLDKLTIDNGISVDDIFDSIELNDQNANVRSALIGMGRKYARSHEVSDEDNEVARSFSPQELKLDDLYNEVSSDIVQIEKDLTEMRAMRTGRNTQRMNELITAKAQYHNLRLSILKEQSSIKKTQYDIKAKVDREKGQGIDDGLVSSSIIQSVFGMGHDTLLDSVGGRAASSGASNGNIQEQTYDSYVEVDETEYDGDSDGDKFIKYENAGVDLVLEEAVDGSRRIYAEDKDGNPIPDYPLPTNLESLTFDINHRAGVATDQLQRNYKYRQA